MSAAPTIPALSTEAPRPDRLLRLALRGNAVFSAATGAVAVLGAGWLDDRLGVPWPVLLVLGIGLGVYAELLWKGTASQEPVDRRLGAFAVIADVAWVLGAAALLILSPDALTSVGRWVLGSVTVVVADLAITQAVGLRRATATAR